MASVSAVKFNHAEDFVPTVTPTQGPPTVVFREPQSPHRFADCVASPITGREEDGKQDLAMCAVSHGGQAALWLLQASDPERYRDGMSAGELQRELAKGLVPGVGIVAINGIRHWLLNLRQVGLVQQEKKGKAVLYSPVENQRVLATIGLFDRLSEDYGSTGIVVPRLFGKPQTDRAGRNSQLTRVRYVRSVLGALEAGASEMPIDALLEDVHSEGTDPSYARDLLGRLAGVGLFTLDRPGLSPEGVSRLTQGSVGVEVSDDQLEYMREFVGGLDAIARGAVRYTDKHSERALSIASDPSLFTSLYENFIPAGNERVSNTKELEGRVWDVLADESNMGRWWTATELAAAVANSFGASTDSGRSLRGRVNIHKITVREILEPLVKAGIVRQQAARRSGAFLYELV